MSHTKNFKLVKYDWSLRRNREINVFVPMKHHDVVIIGGGVSALSVVLGLTRQISQVIQHYAFRAL